MPSVSEAAGQASRLQAIVDAGVEALSLRATVTFTLYNSVSVSEDGFRFWVPTTQTLQVTGALHYSSDVLQDEDQTATSNQVILSAQCEVTEFNLIEPETMWIGTWPVSGGSQNLLLAFSARHDYFVQANIWHYTGIAVLPAMQAQIIASESDLPSGPIVSNSLPFWLAQNAQASVYPSFLVPRNAAPPYVVAHVEPSGTIGLQGLPILTGWPNPAPNPLTPQLYELASHQLCKDHVRLTLYGLNNQQASAFLYSLIDYSVTTDNFGLMSFPSIRDEKRTQREIFAIAQKKCIDLDVSYYQGSADVVARRYILQAIETTSFATA